MKSTQTSWIANQLTKTGTITRNQCLRRYISRLAARIADLRAAGWEIDGARYKTDYRYTLIKRP
jgi:hypothetical protein